MRWHERFWIALALFVMVSDAMLAIRFQEWRYVVAAFGWLSGVGWLWNAIRWREVAYDWEKVASRWRDLLGSDKQRWPVGMDN